MPDVIVIGAGLAGLRAAGDLVAQGADVLVLEARERVGGRVFSHRFTNGQTAERGAEFIDGNHTEVLATAHALGLALSDRSPMLDEHATLLDAGGRAVPMDLHASLADDLAKWNDLLATMQPTDAFEDRTLADAITSLPLSVMSRVVIGREVRTEFMLPPEAVSQRFAAQVALLRRPDQRERHRVIGGNDQLASGLAATLTGRLRLRTPVASIDTHTGSVRTIAGDELSARHLVAAVPLPVLSRLWGEMPPELHAVGYGVGAKISVQFDRRLWLDTGRNGTVLTERSWGHAWETSDDQAGDTGVLTNLIASYDGAAFGALPEAPDHFVREMDRIFPGALSLAGERVHTDWTNDPYSLGTYACFGAGQWSAAQYALHAAHGRMWVAGEHADEYTGFMEGALRSGARVAAAISR